jgi:hypothetical protein
MSAFQRTKHLTLLPSSNLGFLRGREDDGGEDIEKLMMSRHTIFCNFAVMVSRMKSGWAPEPRKGFGSNAHLKNQLRQDLMGCLPTACLAESGMQYNMRVCQNVFPENEQMAGSAAVLVNQDTEEFVG